MTTEAVARYDAVWFINNPAYKFTRRGDGDTARRKRCVVRPIPVPKAERNLEYRELMFHIWFAMQVMKPRERKITILYFGLDGGEAMTYAQIGELLAVSPERIRQILLRGLERIYHSRAGRMLEDLWGVYNGPLSRTRPRKKYTRRQPITVRVYQDREGRIARLRELYLAGGVMYDKEERGYNG